MKRIQLFELEDAPWFPAWLREAMTLVLATMHRGLKTSRMIQPLLEKGLSASRTRRIVDLCSGGGGPMLDAHAELRKQFPDLQLLLTDLYPNEKVRTLIAARKDPQVSYHAQPIDAARVDAGLDGLRTMVGCFHHMPVDVAKAILRDAATSRRPLCIFELSDNSTPTALWWTAIPFVFILTLVITPWVRPLRWGQLFFTYVVPIIPLCVAFDGAASNPRTYTPDDLRELVADLESDHYHFEIGVLRKPGLPGGMSYLLGLPISN